MAIVTSSEGLKCCLLLINLRQSISDLVLPSLSWFVRQAEVTGNKVAWPLVISFICLHSGFQKLLREMLDKICWRFSHKQNTSSFDLLWNAQYLAVLCRLALKGISLAEQTSLGPLWVRDIHRKPDAKPAIPGAQQHTVSINSLFLQLWCVQVWQSSLLDDFHPPICSHLSASLLVRDESVGRYFCLLAFTFSVTGSFMHSDLCCSESMLCHIHSAMSNNKVDEISQQKILLKGLLHARHSVLFNHEVRQTSKGAQPHHAVDGRIYLVKLKDSLVLLFLWEFQ